MKKYNREIIFLIVVLLFSSLIGCVSYAPGEAPPDLLVNRKWQVVDGLFGKTELQPELFTVIEIKDNKWIETDIHGDLALSGEITKLTNNKITVYWLQTPGADFLKGQHTPYFYKISDGKLFLKLYRDAKVFGSVNCVLVE